MLLHEWEGFGVKESNIISRKKALWLIDLLFIVTDL
jgi:hypothetical protein